MSRQETVVDINSRLIRFDSRIAKVAQAPTLSECRDELDRMLYRAKYHGDTITLEQLEKFAIDLRDAQYEDDGAADALSEIAAIARGWR